MFSLSLIKGYFLVFRSHEISMFNSILEISSASGPGFFFRVAKVVRVMDEFNTRFVVFPQSI